MKQVLHIFKKDCRRFWPHLLGYGGVLAFLFHQAVNLPPLREDFSLDLVFLLLSFGLPVLMTALLVLEDPVADRKAFWMTRPIHWRHLLMAKISFLMLFLVCIPLILQAAALWVMGAEADVFVRAAVSSLLDLLPILGLAAAVAVLCRNLQLFVVAGTVILVSHSVLGEALRGSFLQADQRILSGDAIRSQHLILVLLLIALAVLTIISQYRTRRVVQTAWILGLGYLAIGFGVPLLPTTLEWRLGQAIQGSPQGELPLRSLDAFRPGEELSRDYRANGPPTDAEKTGIFLGLVLAEPYQTLFELSSIQGRFESPGLSLKAWRDVGWIFGDLLADFRTPPQREARNSLHLAALFNVEPSLIDDQSEVAGHLRSRLFYRSLRVSERARVPLVEGARFEKGSMAVLIESVRPHPDGLEIVYRQRFLSTDPWHGGFLTEHILPPLPMHHGRNESSEGSSRQLILSGCKVIHSRTRLEFTASSGWDLDERWLADAELLLTETVQVGVADQIIELEGVRLKDLTMEAWQDRILR